MALNLKELTEQLEIEDQDLMDFKNQIVESFGNEQKMWDTLNRQCLNQEDAHCLLCDDEGDCFILNGIIHLALNNPENAIKELENANQQLRSKDETWNCIIGLVLLGIANEKCQRGHLALREYKSAYEMLKGNYLLVHANDYIEKARLLDMELQYKLGQLSSQNHSAPSHPKADPAHVNLNPPGNNGKDYLTLFSIPIYGTVEAGPDGALHIDHFDTFTIVSEIELQGQAYSVHSIHGTASMDRQITVTSLRTYGWARVHGLSMNGWDVPFDENDYVLFYRASTASHLDFVIASNRLTDSDMSLIVKRFDGKNNRLLSKSKNSSRSYDPIPVDRDHQIVGVVIAVAKPLNDIPSSASLNARSETPTSPLSAEEDKLYNKLITRAQGRKDVIERLLNEAYKKLPQASRLELLKHVDDEWNDDNTRHDNS